MREPCVPSCRDFEVGSRLRVAVSTGLALLALAMAGTGPGYAQSRKADATQQRAAAPADEAHVRRLQTMVQAMAAARDRHLLKPDNPQLIEGAIRGMLAALDPDAELYHRSQVMSVASKALRASSTHEVGLQVSRLPAPPRRAAPGWRILSVSDGSPAARIGLRAGDIITHIDGRPASEWTRLELDTLLFRANAAGHVMLRTQHRPAAEVLLEREVYAGALSDIELVAGGLIYARLPRLTEAGVRDLTRRLEVTTQSANWEIRGLVLDLRDVSDDDYGAAVKLADAFLDGGVIARRVSRQPGEVVKDHHARPGSLLRGKAIAVLVNAGTMGAAEVVAAALQDNRRATVVGRTTAGQASTRTLTPLDPKGERGFLLMQTARYHTPNGRPLDKTGVEPDIKLGDETGEACRELDRPADDGSGLCHRRQIADDAALAAAAAHLLRAQIAAGKH